MAAAFQPEEFGSFRLTHLLGKGGMASVFRATREGPWGFAKQVALKRLHSSLNEDQAILKALINEARIGGQLKHPNIVEVYEFNKVRIQGVDAYYLAMEFVDGWTLDKVLKVSREFKEPIPPDVAIDIVVQICAGLHYAHTLETIEGESVKLVHRDIKPANIIVARDGVGKVMDFGIAKATTNLYQTTLAGETTKGTPHYMSPEQVAGDPDLDARSDLFAVGSLIYELVTGKLLFKGDSLVSVLFAVAKAQVAELLGELDRDVPGLAAIVERCLAKDPVERYSNAEALADDLRSLTSASSGTHHRSVRGYLQHLRALVIRRDQDLQESATVADEHGPAFATLLGPDWAEEDDKHTEQLAAAREIADGVIEEIAQLARVGVPSSDEVASSDLVAGDGSVAAWEDTADVDALSELELEAATASALSPRDERHVHRLSVPGSGIPTAETEFDVRRNATGFTAPLDRTRDYPPIDGRLPSVEDRRKLVLIVLLLLFGVVGVVGILVVGAGPPEVAPNTTPVAENVTPDLGMLPDLAVIEPVTERPTWAPTNTSTRRDPTPAAVPVTGDDPNPLALATDPATAEPATEPPTEEPVSLAPGPGPAPAPVTTTTTATSAATSKPGQLQVKRAPTSLLVYVDGEAIGNTPVFGHKLSAGRHSIRFKHPTTGEYSPSKTVTIPSGGRKVLGWYDFSSRSWKE